MRAIAVGVVLAGLVATDASAGGAGFSVGDLVYTHAVIEGRTRDHGSVNSPFSQLSKASRAWIADETRRQIENPRTAMDVALDANTVLEKDATAISRRSHIDPLDITRVVTLLVMADAEDAAAKVAKKAKKGGDPAAADAAARRLEQATANRKEAFAMQSDVSMALAMM